MECVQIPSAPSILHLYIYHELEENHSVNAQFWVEICRMDNFKTEREAFKEVIH